MKFVRSTFLRTVLPRTVAWVLAATASLLASGFAPAGAGSRVALVVGNGDYTHLSLLSNPHRDAKALADVLKLLGWEVIEGVNLTFVQLHDALAELESKASGAEVALVYYAGHGMSHQNRDFVAPTDMPDNCAGDALKRGIPLDRVFQAVDRAQRKIVLLDACRNQPFPSCAKRGGEGGFRGLGRVRSSGLLIVSATGPGGVAADGPPGAHSPFARALLDNFRSRPNAYLHELLLEVVKEVHRATREQQTPELVVRGVPPETCLAARACRALAALSQGDAKMQELTEVARREAVEEVERLRRRLKEATEKAEENAARLRREAEEAEKRLRDAALKAEAVHRQMQEAELRRLHERQAVQPAIVPPAAACGWYAIAYCSEHASEARARAGAFGGFVIESGNYKRFRPGYFCVAQGPMGRAAALSVMEGMKASGAATAYVRNSC